MNSIAYTQDELRLSTQFAQAWSRAKTDKRAMFEALMSAVIFGAEFAERNAASQAEVERERGSA